nr:unnamed protein product [Digitaria exilis]
MASTASAMRGGGVQAQPLVPAVISFSDATVDVGNNNWCRGCCMQRGTRLGELLAAVPQPAGIGEEPHHRRQLRLGGVQLPCVEAHFCSSASTARPSLLATPASNA